MRIYIGENPSSTHNYTLEAPLHHASSRAQAVNKILFSPAFGIQKLSDANEARLALFRYKNRLGNLEHEIWNTKSGTLKSIELLD